MRTKRIISIVIDIFIIMFIGLNIFWLTNKWLNIDNEKLYNNIQLIWMTILFSTKDLLFKNCSIGKKILKLQVLRTDNNKPSVITLFLRNLTILLWPIELIMLIIFDKRLGDIIFKTKVVGQ